MSGTLNCLLTDGKRLLCYHDLGGWKGLCYRHVFMRDQESRRFEDTDLTLELGKNGGNFGVVVATKPLTPTGWQTFQRGELLVLEDGAVRFSSHQPSATA